MVRCHGSCSTLQVATLACPRSRDQTPSAELAVPLGRLKSTCQVDFLTTKLILYTPSYFIPAVYAISARRVNNESASGNYDSPIRKQTSQSLSHLPSWQ